MMMRMAKKIGRATSTLALATISSRLSSGDRLAEKPFDVLDHDDGAVHHHADGDGEPTEGHQIGGDAKETHADEGGQHRERNGESHNQTRSDTAHEKRQHQNHQADADQKRRCHGTHRGLHQALLLVIGHDPDTRREGSR